MMRSALPVRTSRSLSATCWSSGFSAGAAAAAGSGGGAAAGGAAAGGAAGGGGRGVHVGGSRGRNGARVGHRNERFDLVAGIGRVGGHAGGGKDDGEGRTGEKKPEAKSAHVTKFPSRIATIVAPAWSTSSR